MKKIMFFATFAVAMIMASCGSKTETSVETLGVSATDSIVEVVEEESVEGDSLVVVEEVDTVEVR